MTERELAFVFLMVVASSYLGTFCWLIWTVNDIWKEIRALRRELEQKNK